ncbi:MAG: FG-GAP-like repeat-containing protein, partial [Pirellulaceae bacterium]|nr:FG-GAP-like repeat-containing protein [Pirellulaceae bacterium]MCU0962923.1 FG-GAP-like repeat-containing protein [Pirellulaceae bacterium]
FVDGARGDHDLTANGEILDPGGPASPIAPGLRITGSALPLPAFVGQRLAYSYTVTNHSPGTAADVSFTNALPRGVHFISASASSGATLEQSGGTVVGNLGPLPSGQSVDVTITMLLTDSGEMLSTATVSSSVTELDLSDNTLTLVTHVSPAPMTLPRETDLAVTATATSDPVGVGGDLTYTLTVTNQGPDTAQGIVLSDTLPAEVQLVSVTGTRTLPPPDNQPLRIRFDYSHDTGYFNPDTWEYFPPFFDSQEKMDLLEMAADYVLQDLRDDLAAIVPAGENHWTATFTDPASGQDAGVEDLEIAANELLVFVGGRDLGGFGSGMLEGGVAGPGGSVAWGSAEFVNAVRTRGEVGASWPAPGDFGPWGGSIAFNLNPAAKFHFGDTLDGLDADELDFLSVAMHELGHVLGIGTSPAWQVRSDSLSGTFRGSFARAAYDAGGAVPLDPELVHWRTDTTDQGDPALMDPVIEAGTREWPTPLDLAALRDIGWGDVPQSRDVPVPYISSGGTVTFDVGELRVGESVTAKIVVRPTQVGTATNSARVTSPGADQNQSNNTVQVTTQVDPCPPLVVNSDWDIDDGVSDGRTTTLREAIRLANLLPGKNTISFDLPRGRAIFVDAPLPTITDPVVIDGTTQPGYAGAPIVSLNGPYWQQAGYTGLHITAGDSVVRGLRINYFLQVSPSGSITGGNGILLEDGGGNIIQGNYLGPHQGSVLGNDTAGIAIVHSDGNRIGGTTPEARNVISGNHNAGILLYESRDNIIVGNYIGTDAEGLHAVPNGVGIALFGSHHNRIGGTAPGAGNVISGNRENGIEVAWRYAWFSGSNSNVLEGNYIGVAADGTTPCGNGLHGIQLYSGAHNIVGGRDPLAANTIAFNGGAGVAYTDSVTRNQILGNSMDSNGGLGIDRWPAGVTETPPYYYFYASPDFPSLTYALSDADTTRIRGTLKSLANTTFELDFYTSAAADPSGHGEGQAWLGTATVTTDALGLAPFYLSFPRSTPAGQFIAATSTGQISTSEFSNSVVVQADRDGDGVADVEEDGGPYSGDADRDGTLDSLQTDVATLRNSGDQQYVTLKSAAGSTLDGVWAIENPSPGNSPYAIPFPLGFFDGVVEDVAAGGSTTVTLLMPAGVVPHSFYQFGAAAGSTSDFWYEFPFDGTTGAEIFPDRVVLHYVDGGRGDHDLEMNRRISFRGGVSGPPAMHVVDTIPAQNDGQAPQDAQVSATFGEDVDPATVSDQTFFVHGAESGQFVVPPNALGVDRATASLTPARPFHPGERVAITATRAIHSADGDTPVAPFSWEFRAAVAGGTATFAESTVEHFGFPETYGVAMKDLDGDGDPDVFLANALPEPSSVWLNNGSGNGHFIDTGQQLGPFDGRDVALDDLDGDGDVDAFVATYGHGNRVFLNDGRGYFTDSSQRLGNALTMGISLGDLDADGDLDAFVANAHGQSNSVWLNDGHALFTDSGQSLGSGDSRDVALGDLDADGDLDAFTADFDRPGEVWLNDGQGRFANSGQQIGSVGNRNVALGDVNGDGSLDAFLVGTDLDAVWLNDGRGQFTGTDAFQNLQDCLGGAAVDVADFDRDGDLDALVARRPSGSYNEGTLWVNVGQGRFVAARWTYGSNYASQGTSTGGQAVADVDGDGDFDAIVANDLGWEGRTMLLENHASAYGISIGGGGIEQSFTRTGVWASAAA